MRSLSFTVPVFRNLRWSFATMPSLPCALQDQPPAFSSSTSLSRHGNSLSCELQNQIPTFSSSFLGTFAIVLTVSGATFVCCLSFNVCGTLLCRCVPAFVSMRPIPRLPTLWASYVQHFVSCVAGPWHGLLLDPVQFLASCTAGRLRWHLRECGSYDTALGVGSTNGALCCHGRGSDLVTNGGGVAAAVLGPLWLCLLRH